jgi:trk system potassium uptake protein TrkH
VELRAFALVVLLSTAILTLLDAPRHGGDLVESLRYAAFQVATFVSSTGYITDDYMAYPSAGLSIVLFLMFVGGCSGSTAGGIKIERVVLMAKQSWAEIHQSFRPSVVRVVRMGRQVVESAVLADVAAFFVVYMGALAIGVAMITAVEQTPVPAAFGAVLSCLSNMGPAPFHTGPDNFANFSAFSKIAFALGMVFGRLEFFTLLALMVPGFWKR